MHLDMACEVNKAHNFAELMFSGKVRKFLLVGEWDLVIGVAGDPGVLQGGRGVVPLRGRVRAQVEEEVLCQIGEMERELPFNRLGFNILKLLIIILSRSVTRMLPAGQEHICHDTAGPQVHLLRVAFLGCLLRCHVNRCASPLVLLQSPVLLGAEPKVDNLHCGAVISPISHQYIGRF